MVETRLSIPPTFLPDGSLADTGNPDVRLPAATLLDFGDRQLNRFFAILEKWYQLRERARARRTQKQLLH